MLSAAEGKHVQEARAAFPFTFPSCGGQPAQETGCKFQPQDPHQRAGVAPRLWTQLQRAGTDPVLLEGNPAGAEYVGALGLGHVPQSRHPLPSSTKHLQKKCPSGLGRDNFCCVHSPHTFTHVVSAELHQHHLGLSDILGQMGKLRLPRPRAGGQQWLFLQCSLCHITRINSGGGTGRKYG